jgi:hypothetical protein
MFVIITRKRRSGHYFTLCYEMQATFETSSQVLLKNTLTALAACDALASASIDALCAGMTFV